MNSNGHKRVGRPRLYNLTQRRKVATYLRQYGLTKGVKECAKQEGLVVSVPTGINIAKEMEITFTRGRPQNGNRLNNGHAPKFGVKKIGAGRKLTQQEQEPKPIRKDVKGDFLTEIKAMRITLGKLRVLVRSLPA